MNKSLLKRHIREFVKKSKKDHEKFTKEKQERDELINYYQSFDENKLLSITEEEVYHYISKLWAMLIWGNKKYVVDKILTENGLKHFQKCIADLVWGKSPIAERWNGFRKNIKGMGPAMISEILCKTHPVDYTLWNRRAYVALRYLEVEGLPRYDYQLTGDTYARLCAISKEIANALKEEGLVDTTLLAVDYFIWSELQVEKNLSKLRKTKPETKSKAETQEELSFIHNDVRDKLKEIGEWLGFAAKVEQKVAAGSKVDAIWESTIGNMGRVIYVFEVQTKGNIDSLIINLLKSLNNQAVQGVVAVSDENQLQKIKSQVSEVGGLRDKLKYWNYEEVLEVHASLAFVNENINKLRLVPEGF